MSGHGPGGMIGDEVQRVEVHPLGFELGTFGDLPAHRDEHVFHDVHQRGDRVNRSDRLGLNGQSDINALFDKGASQLGGLDLLLACLECFIDPAASLADPTANLSAGLGRQRADLPVGESDRRAIAGVCKSGLLELGSPRSPPQMPPEHPPPSPRCFGVQRRDLNGVVVGVRPGHGSLGDGL